MEKLKPAKRVMSAVGEKTRIYEDCGVSFRSGVGAWDVWQAGKLVATVPVASTIIEWKDEATEFRGPLKMMRR